MLDVELDPRIRFFMTMHYINQHYLSIYLSKKTLKKLLKVLVFVCN